MASKAFWCLGLIWLTTLTDESCGEPETVEGLLKKNQNSWINPPIVAHQPNENKPTKVIGGYPGFKPDTLARPLKAQQQGRVPFGQYLHAFSSVLPNHVLKWLSQRQRLKTTLKPILPTPGAENTLMPKTDIEKEDISGGGDPIPALTSTSINPQIEKPLTKPDDIVKEINEKEKLFDDMEKKSAKKEEILESSTKESKETSTNFENDEVTMNPRVAAVIINDYIARREDKISVAGLVIGLTFVAAFVSMVIGLLGHGMFKRFAKQESSGRSSRNSWMRSPGDDDRTPPELRPGSHSGHPVYSDSSRRNSGRTRHLPGTLPGHNGTPFFNGKLILHDPPGMGNGNRGLARPFNPGNVLANTSNNAGGFLMTSPPSKLGAIPKKMPSPAAQVTDILVSPKYDDEETTEEEEDSDDTVYECPGLAAATRNGGGLEVRNPFFMDGDLQPAAAAAAAAASASADGADSNNGGKSLANKKPISQYTDLFHHQEIAGLN